MINLGFTPEALHKFSSSALPQTQKKKELQPQRYQVKWFASKFHTWPLHTTDRRRHFFVLDLHLVQNPSPFISLLLSIYWIRKPYSRKRTFSRTQHQHFQYSDIWFCRCPYSIPREFCEVPHKLFPWQHNPQSQRLVSENTFYVLRCKNWNQNMQVSIWDWATKPVWGFLVQSSVTLNWPKLNQTKSPFESFGVVWYTLTTLKRFMLMG